MATADGRAALRAAAERAEAWANGSPPLMAAVIACAAGVKAFLATLNPDDVAEVPE